MLFDITQGDESLTSHSGLALIGLLLQKTKIQERLNAVHHPDHPSPAIAHGDNALEMIEMLCLGQPDFAAIEPFRDDPFFRGALQLKQVPSEGTLRQRLNDAQGAFDAILREESAGMIARHAPRITPCHKDLVPIDADVSPYDNSGTHKEGVLCTYKKVDGYAPIFAYLGEEGYLINAELREGQQHGQKGTPEFLRETIALYHAHGTSKPFHSEIKSDLDLERLPSGKFATNALVLLLGLLAYNGLRLCGQESLRDEGLPLVDQAPLRKQVSRRRLRSVMQDLMYMASQVIAHARRVDLAFGKGNPWNRVWRRVYVRFAAATG